MPSIDGLELLQIWNLDSTIRNDIHPSYHQPGHFMNCSRETLKLGTRQKGESPKSNFGFMNAD